MFVPENMRLHDKRALKHACMEQITTLFCFPKCLANRPNQLRFVYTHSKSCNLSLDKTPLNFSNIFRAMQSYAMSTKSTIILKLPKGYGRMT